jgi:predicted  nucleic acid-binding Zn-ribbon protein
MQTGLFVHKVTLLKQPLPPLGQTGSLQRLSPKKAQVSTPSEKATPLFSPAELLLEEMAIKVPEKSADSEQENNDDVLQEIYKPVQENVAPPNVSDFVKETHSALVKEFEDLENEVELIEGENTKLLAEIKELKEHVKLGEETLQRDLSTSKQYEEDVIKIREQIRSGELTLRNMEEKENHIAAEKEARLSTFSTSTSLLVQERSSLSSTLSQMLSYLESVESSVSTLLSTLAAKEDLNQLSNAESRLSQSNVQKTDSCR